MKSDEKKDPVFDAIHGRMKECEDKAKGLQAQINLCAEELTLLQGNRRKAMNEAAKLRGHLDIEYPRWDADGDFALEA
jgi:hypothetical protein